MSDSWIICRGSEMYAGYVAGVKGKCEQLESNAECVLLFLSVNYLKLL